MLIAIIVLVVIVLGAGATYIAMKLHDKANNVTGSSNCAPLTGNTVDKQAAESTFTTFAAALKKKDQACVDSLSTSYFKTLETQAFPGSKGKWVTKSEGSLPSMATRLANLPSTFEASSFASTSYTRTATFGSNGQPIGSTVNLPQGLTLRYTITDAYTKLKESLVISVVSSSNKILVDGLELSPQSSGK
jgi:hypothetical protein